MHTQRFAFKLLLHGNPIGISLSHLALLALAILLLTPAFRLQFSRRSSTSDAFACHSMELYRCLYCFLSSAIYILRAYSARVVSLEVISYPIRDVPPAIITTSSTSCQEGITSATPGMIW